MKAILSNCLILMCLFNFGHSQLGFFSEDWEVKSGPLFNLDSTILEAPNTHQISFSISTPANPKLISSNILGNNGNFYLYGLKNDSAGLAHLKATGMKNFRLPGGNASNKWLWDDQVHWPLWDQYQDSVKNGPFGGFVINTDEQIEIADSIGAMVQPCVNFSLSRYIKGADSVEQAASYAAEWVRELNIRQGRNVKYWEVGNENYGKWQAGFIVNGDTINGTMYGEAFQIFADSMKSADPSIKVGAVVYEGHYSPGTGNWNEDVIPLVANHADFLAVHQYFTWAPDMNSISVEEVLGALPKIEETKHLLDSTVQALTSLTPNDLPVAMTEYNVRAGSKNSQLVSAIFIAMALGEFVEHEYGLVNIWDIANAYNNGDDHGMLTRNDPNRDNFSPNPSFYTYYLFNKMMGDKLLEVSPQEASDIRVYPSHFSSDQLGVMVINQGADQQQVELVFDDHQLESYFWSYTLEGSSLTSREIFVNGQSGGPYSGPINYQDIEPITHHSNTPDKPVIEVPPYSVNFYLFEQSVPTNSIQKTPMAGFPDKGLRFFGSTTVESSIQPKQVLFYNSQGQLIPGTWSWHQGKLKLQSPQATETWYTIK